MHAPWMQATSPTAEKYGALVREGGSPEPAPRPGHEAPPPPRGNAGSAGREGVAAPPPPPPPARQPARPPQLAARTHARRDHDDVGVDPAAVGELEPADAASPVG